jgi:hypothetical protein
VAWRSGHSPTHVLDRSHLPCAVLACPPLRVLACAHSPSLGVTCRSLASRVSHSPSLGFTRRSLASHFTPPMPLFSPICRSGFLPAHTPYPLFSRAVPPRLASLHLDSFRGFSPTLDDAANWSLVVGQGDNRGGGAWRCVTWQRSCVRPLRVHRLSSQPRRSCSRPLFYHRARCSAFVLLFCLLFVLVLQVSTIPAHLFLMMVAALGSLYKTITMISRLINDKRLTCIVETTAGENERLSKRLPKMGSTKHNQSGGYESRVRVFGG